QGPTRFTRGDMCTPYVGTFAACGDGHHLFDRRVRRYVWTLHRRSAPEHILDDGAIATAPGTPHAPTPAMVSALFGAMSFWTLAEQTVAATLAWLFATEV